MQNATILTPASSGKRYSAFRQNPIFPNDQNMKKYQYYNDARGEILPNNDSCCESK